MKHRLRLHVPRFDELWYRERMLSDPQTMAYNAGYELPLPGYHNDTGCIDFPQERWQGWYERFIGREPERFYAYAERIEDGVFIGEVNLHTAGVGEGHYEMGIVIEARYRGLGYSEGALRLLIDYAFDRLHADSVCNSFGSERVPALKAHLAVGFRPIGIRDGAVDLRITRDTYR